MIVKAEWMEMYQHYNIPDKYYGFYIAEVLAKQEPRIITGSMQATNLFLSCSRDIKPGYNRTITVTHSASEFQDLKDGHKHYTLKVVVPKGEMRERKRNVVIATISFLNTILREEKEEYQL